MIKPIIIFLVVDRCACSAALCRTLSTAAEVSSLVWPSVGLAGDAGSLTSSSMIYAMDLGLPGGVSGARVLPACQEPV